ncbi:hypothetical protein HDU83_003061 [Entophlyctis luteolus]|nr:hypothetical protein HDU82_005218 [Entophlyctis luteolus]KAJ3346490.1 hypothetical protein HDU83_003061 [Entophlyctis luteolus]KAJ3384314.1 hypothetical protein HDU84_003036 [Entophlyctis sp. JEL0112]
MELLEVCARRDEDVDAVRAFFSDATAESPSPLARFAHPANGWTALMWAARRNHIRIAELLLRNGADPAARNARNETAADLCPPDASDLRRILGAEPATLDAAYPPATAAVFVPNYLVDPASIPLISDTISEFQPREQQLQQLEPQLLPDARNSRTSGSTIIPDPSSTIGNNTLTRKPHGVNPEADLQEIVVYADADIVGAVHVTKEDSIAELMHLVYEELDINRNAAKSISRLTGEGLKIPIAAKQFPQSLCFTPPAKQ